MKLAIVGYYGYKNFGDDLFHFLTSRMLDELNEDDEISLNVLASGVSSSKVNYLIPRKIENIYSSASILGTFIRLIFAIYVAIRFDKVVFFGGSLFSHKPSNVLKYVYLPAVRLGMIKLGAFGVSIGPFNNGKEQNDIIEVLKNFSFVFVRDKKSIKYSSGLENVYPGVDIASISKRYFKLRKPEITTQIGVCPCLYNEYVGGNPSRDWERVDSIINYLQKYSREYDINIRLFALNSNESVGDRRVVDYMMQRLDELEIKYTSYTHTNIDETSRNLLECDFTINIRLHGAIFSYAMGIPFVLYEYHEKCSAFLNDVDWPYRITPSQTELSLQSMLNHSFNSDKYYKDGMDSFESLRQKLRDY